uniref:Prolactin receptor n=1 Tax=Erpetoichthys calabaricus TaxID=27687 RepID=A0A8C4RJJ2_ERPCA
YQCYKVTYHIFIIYPQIKYCRSANMETFTCWWTSQSGNTTDSMNINYTLTYTFGPVNECPDYVTGGNNSCFFDSRHTQIWEVYCLNVKAWNTFGSQTSDEYCLDVADAVEPDPPVNISYKITNDSFGESGKTVVITWQAPETADVDIGWLTLIYELQFRLSSEPEEWKGYVCVFCDWDSYLLCKLCFETGCEFP